MKVIDDSTENTGKDNGSNEDIKRDASGRFVPGSRGGPGKKKRQPVTLADIEQNLQDDLKSKDHKIRHAAVKLYLMLKKQMVSDKPVTLSRELQAMVDHVSGQLFSDDEVTPVTDDDFFH